ncbi:uncharacterized protein EURHEDRAFT_550533 [Aspergillus ruber CBS 135680]|uniref:Uncharacterized protein n=1 Tax=Aspergillus ruber (strain CBS 135680) TaxID=1388766 RepID=A0A017S0F9_ASPRC|nr:uncharacterized protein EURHEDRAFT_550533 [Aspergillus ruber CBS 135680]EYE90336.1 hypothetical protein EURHEDRAFT_550533 [Aspergillus ruber CBS 135680]
MGWDNSDYMGRTALFHAAVRGYEGFFQQLRMQGSDIHRQDRFGLTPCLWPSYSAIKIWSSKYLAINRLHRSLGTGLAGVCRGGCKKRAIPGCETSWLNTVCSWEMHMTSCITYF